MKKKKKNYNIKRALTLKNNILKHNNKINLPETQNIKFKKTNFYDDVEILKFDYNLINYKIDLQSDDLLKGKKIKDTFVKTIKVQLFPNLKQKKMLIDWMDTWITMYNKVLSIIKEERKKQSEKLKKSLKYNEIELKNISLNKLKKDLKEFKQKLIVKSKIDSHTLDYCINDALNSLSSSISNLNNGHCKKSRLRFLKKTKKNKIIKLENSAMTPTSFCISRMGQYMKTKKKINFKKMVEGTCIIQQINNKFYILIKKKNLKVKKHKYKQQKIISLDPGHRTFLSGLSNDHLLEIGNGVDKKIKKGLLKIDKIKSLKKIKNKRRKLLKREKDLKNYVNNLQWKITHHLVKNYNHILLGNYSTKSMVESNKTNDMTKRIGSYLRFYQFREKLKYKCLLNDCKMAIIDEYNTTKSCSNCSCLNDIGSSKEYNCQGCNKKYPRDINSSKNILINGIVN